MGSVALGGVASSSAQRASAQAAQALHLAWRRPAAARPRPAARRLLPQPQLTRRAVSVARVARTADLAGAGQFGADADPLESALGRLFGVDLAPTLVTIVYVAGWYVLHLAFNLQNKAMLTAFPYPWFIATVHVVVGAAYCAALYALGSRSASFERPLTRQELGTLLPAASMHALGHIASNLSFVAVALSLTHTVKTLEPAFSAVLQRLVLGQDTPALALLCLLPIMGGVAAASASELSFNWLGFNMAMASNLLFSMRAVYSKRAMGSIKSLGSTGIYAYTTLISVFICAPGVLLFERGVWGAAQAAAAAHGGAWFAGSLLSVGLLYHLYNQFAFNALARLSAVSHGVANVVNRVVVILASVVVFGNELTPQTKIGTAVTLLGTLLYAEALRASKAQAAPKPGYALAPSLASAAAAAPGQRRGKRGPRP